MDIAKYIGLYLLKNQFCYVHGLGNIEVKKRSGAHDGTALQPPSYEVIVTPGGSIDDNLANFIATNEQISISKAANALREYSTQAKKDLAEGKEVPVPNVGKFVEEGGKIRFITDPHFKFTPAGIPTIKNSRQLDEQNSKPVHKPSYPPPTKADAVNWSMVIIVAVLLLIVGGGGYGVYYYLHNSNKPAPAPPPPVVVDTVKKELPPPVPDSVRIKDSIAAAIAAAPVDTTAVKEFRMVIGDYTTRERAEKRLRNLKINGNHVDMVQKDSLTYLVVASINCRIMDTMRAKDSLQILFGYKNVSIMK